MFWSDENFTLHVLKLRNKDVFLISIAPKEGVPQTAFFTGNEFSSLVCEMVKYCLDLPVEARGIPCPISCIEKTHGCLETMKAKIDKEGKMFVKFDECWLKYHGEPQKATFIWDEETGKAWIEAPNDEKRRKRVCPYCGATLSDLICPPRKPL